MDSMKTIALSRGMSTVVDDDVYEWVSEMKWHAASGHAGKWYAAASVKRDDGSKTTEYLHRLITGAGDGWDVDHWDGDGLNNRHTNLRVLTHKQNQENVPGGYGACGVRGVTPSRSGRFRAQVKTGGKCFCLGTFDTIEEAALVAAQARQSLFAYSDGR